MNGENIHWGVQGLRTRDDRKIIPKSTAPEVTARCGMDKTKGDDDETRERVSPKHACIYQKNNWGEREEVPGS